MWLDGANQTPEVIGQNELPGKSNYFVGNDPNGWKTDVPNFSGVLYQEVYPGIDQVFYGNGRQLEYDFILAPEADATQIAIAFDGASGLRISDNGEIIFSVRGEIIVQKKPFVYQEIDGVRTEIAANYSIRNPRSKFENPTVGFEIGDYDRSKPLTIDPVLVYSTYLGGNQADSGWAVAIDAARNVYVTGSTSSPNFPTVNPLQPNNAGGSGDVFVTKINTAGNQILYSTYIGGTAGDLAYGIDVDNAGGIYVTGVTGGTSGPNNFPTTTGAFDRNFNAPDEAFLLKLNASGNALEYSTYTGAAIGSDVKVDKATGEAFIAGNAGANLATTPGAFRPACPCATSNAFVTKFNAAGSGLIYSTYIGPGPANGLAIDAEGSAYITGSTTSSAFPITPGAAQPTCTGCNLFRSDAFVTKLNPAGSALAYSTYLGGSIDEVGSGIAVDADGNAYVTGRTESGTGVSVSFPTTPGVFQTASLGIPDAFVTKLNPAGTAFVYSTFLGGPVRDEGFGIAVDPLGKAHIIGQTRSREFPLADPFQSICTINGNCVFMATLNPAGSAVLFSTFFGQGEGRKIVADNSGNIYATGITITGLSNLPTMNPIQPNHGAGSSSFDGFVAKIEVQRIQTQSALFDFDGDGRSDVSVFRPSDRVWYLLHSTQGFAAAQFGLSTDRIVPADFDGDGKTDLAAYRDGVWYLLNSSSGAVDVVSFGLASDIPVPADFTGDGRAEVAVYRNGIWWTLNLNNNQSQTVQFGISSDKPVPADFDGDGKTDFAVYRGGVWYWLRSSDNGFEVVQFGLASDRPVVADYDGDGKVDPAVYRDGVWYILQSQAGLTTFQWGLATDIPSPADFDGDGKADAAVYRDGVWWQLRSQAGFQTVQFGLAGDKPIPAAFVP